MSEQVSDARTAIDETFTASVGYASKVIAKTHGQDPTVTGYVDKAYQAVKSASIAARQGLDYAEKIAANQAMYPAGRAAEVEATKQAVAQKINDAVSDAELSIRVAEAGLIMAARPTLQGDQLASQNFLSTILDKTPANQRSEVLKKIAGANNDASAALFSDFGRSLCEALGVDSAIMNALDEWNIEAARESGTGTRKAAAETLRNLAGLRQGVDGVKAGAYMAQQHLAQLHAQAGADPRDLEIRRLRRQLSLRDGHAQ